MTALSLVNTTQMNDSYALFSPEARMARRQVVVAAPPRFYDTPFTIRTIELREQPFAPLFRKLDAFASLSADWDSYGAAKITSAASATARALLRDLSLRPAGFGATTVVPFSIAPVATGGINIEWRRADAAMELWIDESGNLEAVIDRPHVQPRFEEKALNGIAAAVHEVLTFAA